MERIIDYPEATEIANDDYVLFDSLTNGTKKFLAKNLGGGTVEDAIKRLCHIVYIGNDSAEIPAIDSTSTTYDADFSSYLSYNSTTKKFTVLQGFSAVIIPWTYNYDSALSSYSQGELYINDTKITDWTLDYLSQGYYKGELLLHTFSQGDTFYNYTPSGDGYPQQNLKVYRLTSQDVVTSVTEMFTFYNALGTTIIKGYNQPS